LVTEKYTIPGNSQISIGSTFAVAATKSAVKQTKSAMMQLALETQNPRAKRFLFLVSLK